MLILPLHFFLFTFGVNRRRNRSHEDRITQELAAAGDLHSIGHPFCCRHSCVGPVGAERCLTCQQSDHLAGTNHPHLYRMALSIGRRDGEPDHEIASPAWIQIVANRCRFGFTLAQNLKFIQSKLDVMIGLEVQDSVDGPRRMYSVRVGPPR